MASRVFDTFDYVLSKEYDTMLLRRFQPYDPIKDKISYVRSLILDDEGHLNPAKPLKTLHKEFLELLDASQGRHHNTGKATVKMNVCHEICDCLFRLMVADVSLGGEDYYDIPWSVTFFAGMSGDDTVHERNSAPHPESPMTQERPPEYDLHGNLRRLGADKARTQIIPLLLRYLGVWASSQHLDLHQIVAEIQRRERWSRRSQDLEKRLDSIAELAGNASLLRAQGLRSKQNLRRLGNITTVAEVLRSELRE